MRRAIVHFTLLLLGGAIVNVAVAWGTILWLPTNPDAYELRRITESTQRWTVTVTQSGFGKTLITRTATIQNEQERIATEEYEVRTGWPVRAFECGGPGLKQIERDGGVMNYPPAIANLEGSIPIHFGRFAGSAFAALPYLPIWVGVAVNTLFYAAILGLLFFAPGKVRRTIRRRRGLCPACAYPIGTSEVCTECGTRL